MRRLAILVVAALVAGCGSSAGGSVPKGPDPLLDGGKPAFPKGELTFVHVGPYKMESDLVADIDRYARGSGS